MLSRVASNLYWMGRYIERAENIARYVKEIYFSSIDAPIEELSSKKFVLESILYMVGIFDAKNIEEREVLYRIGFDKECPNSLLHTITNARENARSARNEISTEIWEAINTYYHFIDHYPIDTFLSTGLYEVTQKILDQSSVVRGKIYGSILYDETWAIILYSMYIERALQTIHILNSKLNDINKIKEMGFPVNKLSFEWATLLRCTESFDMNRKYYRSIPNKDEVLEFLLLNEKNPRSLYFTIISINNFLTRFSSVNKIEPGTIRFKLLKLESHYRFLTITDFKEDVYALINHTFEVLNEANTEFEKKYLSY